mmetsp:Transcript_24924/g.78013  ORF Transcript_24924/g.78013 Transcript_24924/m.78013 type:complete len:225 (+) Transcript_24924:1436-2110(+)
MTVWQRVSTVSSASKAASRQSLKASGLKACMRFGVTTVPSSASGMPAPPWNSSLWTYSTTTVRSTTLSSICSLSWKRLIASSTHLQRRRPCQISCRLGPALHSPPSSTSRSPLCSRSTSSMVSVSVCAINMRTSSCATASLYLISCFWNGLSACTFTRSPLSTSCALAITSSAAPNSRLSSSTWMDSRVCMTCMQRPMSAVSASQFLRLRCSLGMRPLCMVMSR